MLEEVENRPYFLRLSLFFKAGSESEARTMLQQMNSLRNTLMTASRPEQVIGSMSMIQKRKEVPTATKRFNTMMLSLAGAVNLNGIEEMDEMSELDSHDEASGDESEARMT